MFTQVVGCSSRTYAARATMVSTRHFHGSPVARKKLGEKVKELGQDVNMKVGKGLASAIDTGEKATQATKEKLEGKAKDMERNAEEGKDYAEKKGEQAARGAQKAKKDFQNELNK